MKQTLGKINKLGNESLSEVHLVVFVLTFVGVGGYIIIRTTASPRTDTALANIWVDSNGGSCTRFASKTAYSDSAACSTIQAAADKTVACDTVVVKPGIYKNYKSVSGDINSAAVTIPAAAGGGACGKTIFVAENRWSAGPKTEVTTDFKARYGFNISNASHIRLEGFEIYGLAPISGGQTVTTNVDSAAIWVGNNNEIVGNNIHDIGGCVTVANDKGQNGIFLDSDNSIIEQNYIHDIGRDSACTTSKQHDHGIYVNGSGSGQTGNTIKNNLFYNNRKGWAVQIYPGIINSLKLVHNTFAENASSDGTKSGNHIITGYGTTINNSTISNNIFYNSDPYIRNGSGQPTTTKFSTIEIGNTLTVTNSEMKNNITSGSAMADNDTNYSKFTGTTTNLTGVSPQFVNSTNDFHLKEADTVAKEKALATSSVDTGVSDDYDGNSRPRNKDGGTGNTADGSTPAYDIGAFEYTTTTPPPTCSTKPGDINGDNAVNISDISALLSAYGLSTTTNCADLDKNGTVNIADLSIILSKYGT